MSYSVGIDMGGTFTDGCFFDGVRFAAVKVPTTHFDLTRSVMACLAQGAEDLGVSLDDLLSGVGLLRLATTVGTNAVVTGTGDPVGLMVEAGAEKSLYGPSEPAPAVGVFVRADQVVGVDPNATVEQVLTLCRDLVQRGVRQTVVSLRGPRRDAELELRELVRDRYPVHYLRSMPLTLGWETADVGDDGLRTSTAVLNAYLGRPMAKLLYRTEGVLQQAGLPVPLLAARSDGTFSRMPRTTAISTYSSGPAAGLGLAAAEARRHGDGPVVGFDMGGTTLDLGLVRDGAYETEATPTIRGVRVWLPVAGIVSIGLGGSSIASITPAPSPVTTVGSGLVTVGPASAGAVPGPAAFGRGGTEPTLTDADVVLGLLADGHALPGDIRLDAERAAAALAPIAGGDPVGAARQVRAAAHAKAAEAVRDMLAGAGIDAADAALYAYGGAAGLHAGEVAELAEIGRVRSFVAGGVFSARGVAEAAVEQRYRAAVEAGDDVIELIARLIDRARLDVETERLDVDRVRLSVELHDATGRYRSTVVAWGSHPARAAASMVGDGDDSRAVCVEVVSVWDPGDGRAPQPSPEPRPSTSLRRHVHWTSGTASTSVADFASLQEGHTVVGPVLVDCLGAVHAIPPGWTCCRVDADSLLWERSG